jgi:signal peptidase
MKSTLKKVANIIPYLILLIAFILIVSVVSSIKKGETPTIFGKAVFLVVSPSMEDTIMVGDIIFVDTNPESYHVGDIISFYKPDDENIVITHRIIEIEEIDGVSYYTTQGDNNFETLDWEIDFDEDQIVGKYTSKSGFIGKIYTAIYSGGISLVFIVIILVFVIIGIMEVFNIIKILSEAKEKKALEEEKDKLVQIELIRLRKEQKEKEE